MSEIIRDTQTLKLGMEDGVATITLSRPEVHNAFNDEMIAELDDVFHRLAEDPHVRVIVLTGSGRSFCAGADLNWMKKMVDYSFEENLKDSMKLADLMYRIYAHPRPTIARVNGATIGGGTGLVAACDIAIAADDAVFSLSEVRIGLVPACIAPYVIRRLGECRARELFLTGQRISAETAQALGLINASIDRRGLDEKVKEKVELLLRSGPEALKTCKRLLETVPAMSLDEARGYTAEMIARLRISEEGQEGMNAFLKKRHPSWVKERSVE